MKRMADDFLKAPNSIASREAAEQIIRRECPGLHAITYVEHGHSNLVAQVDKRYVFRFPRAADTAKRFAFETSLLARLAERQLAPIPVVYKKSAQPAYAILQFLPGEHLQASQMLALPVAVQAEYGAQLAAFVHHFQQAISPAEIRKLRQAISVDEVEDRWEQYLPKVFGGLADPQLRAIVDHYYTEWQAMVAHEQMDVVVHGDLHGQNILFEAGRLSGVLDFEFADVGSIEQECRTLYQFGPALLGGFVAEYERLSTVENLAPKAPPTKAPRKRGLCYIKAQAMTRTCRGGGALGAKFEIHTGHIRTWAIVGELATFCTRTARGQTSHPSYLRARANLREWLPDFPE